MRTHLTFLFIVFAFMAACTNSSNNNPSGTAVNADDTLGTNPAIPDDMAIDDLTSGIPIYYNMYLTVELSSLFEAEGAHYQPELLNPVENVSAYLTSSDKALNLGVYAVDLSYCRVFEQYQKAGSYFSAMYQLAQELGIPQEFIQNSAERMDKNIGNKDSLRAIANEVYVRTDEYLKANEREHAAALIVLGGWIEAVYLGSEIFDLSLDNEDLEYMSRLEEQKYSLVNLIQLLNKYKQDPVVNKMIVRLNDLRPDFESFTVDEGNPQKSVNQLKKINDKVKELRALIVG